MKKTKSTMKRIFNSPSRRKGNKRQNKKNLYKRNDNSDNNSNSNSNVDSNNDGPSSVASDDILGLNPPKVKPNKQNSYIFNPTKSTKANQKKNNKIKKSKSPSSSPKIQESKKIRKDDNDDDDDEPPTIHIDSRLDDTKDHLANSFSDVNSNDETETQHRKNAFLYLDRYEDMVRAQDNEDEATITHLRPIFYTIRRLAIENGDMEPDSSDEEEDDDNDDGSGDDDSEDGDVGSDVNVNGDDDGSGSFLPIKNIGSNEKKGGSRTGSNGNVDDESTSKDTKKEEVSIVTPPSKEGKEYDSDDDHKSSSKASVENFDDLVVESKSSNASESQKGDQKKGQNEEDTSFTVNHDSTFMENKDDNDLEHAGSTNGTNNAGSGMEGYNSKPAIRDTSFTANHDQTFMKSSDNAVLAASGSGLDSQKTPTEEKSENNNDDNSESGGGGGDKYVSTGYLDTTHNTITAMTSLRNDHNIILPFTAIVSFIDRIKNINEVNEGSDEPVIAAGPKSDYHILQTDAQLMLILSNIAETVESKQGEDGSDVDEYEFSGGLTFAEFVHVYKSVIAGMQTLQMLPAPSDINLQVSDPEYLSNVREMTRERTLQMIRAFTVSSIEELTSLFEKDESTLQESSDGVSGLDSPKMLREASSFAKDAEDALAKKNEELESLSRQLEQAKMEQAKSKSGGSGFKLMIFSLLCGIGIGHQYFTYQSNELAKLDIIQVKSELYSANKEVKSLYSEIGDLDVELKKKDEAFADKHEEFLKCEKSLRTIEDYYNGDVTQLKAELEQCQESSRFKPSDANVEDAKKVIKSSQSLQKVIMRRQVMTAVGTALIAAVPSFLKFLLNILFF
jgi:hypothetical protein